MARNLERPGCSFREAVAFLTLLEAEHPHGRTAGARQEPQPPLFFVGLSRKAERYSALAPIRIRSDREGCAHHESARGSFQHPV